MYGYMSIGVIGIIGGVEQQTKYVYRPLQVACNCAYAR